MTVVKISKRAAIADATPSPIRRILTFTLVDKFFLIGAVAGLCSSLWLGAYVWLMRSGVVTIRPTYESMRGLHAFLQFYLFFTPFILGFLVQSAPKLFESQEPLPALVRFALPVVVFGALAKIFFPSELVPSLAIAGGLWSVAVSFVFPFSRAPWSARLRFGVFALVSLLSLGAGAFLDLGVPVHGVVLFWFGIVAIIFATGQQFIAGALQGVHPPPRWSLVTLALFGGTGVSLLSGWIEGATPVFSAVLAVLSFASFLYSTRARVILSRGKEPLGFAFLSAHLWAFAGACMLARGPIAADAIIHLWGVGYAATLIIAISLRLIAWITEVALLSDRMVMAILVAWQFVPFVRGFELILALPTNLIVVATAVSAIVLFVWVGTIGYSVVGMVRRQMKVLRSARPAA